MKRNANRYISPNSSFPVTIAQCHFEATGTNNNHKGALKSPKLNPEGATFPTELLFSKAS